jgi:hypothetical protein
MYKMLFSLGFIQMSERSVREWGWRGNLSLLRLAVEHGSSRERQVACHALATLEGNQAKRMLSDLLQDQRIEVAVQAARILEEQQGKTAKTKEVLQAWDEQCASLEQGKTLPYQPVFDKSKLTRFNDFKKQVLSMRNKGNFYG